MNIYNLLLICGEKLAELIFRKATQSDLEDIIYLLADDELGKYRENLVKTIPSNYLNAFEKIDADPNHLLMVLESKNTFISTCHLIFIPSLTFQGGLRINIEGVRIENKASESG